MTPIDVKHYTDAGSLEDFYDLLLLSQQFDFDGPLLATAITRTFAHRQTAVTPVPVALTPAFAADAGKPSANAARMAVARALTRLAEEMGEPSRTAD